MSDLIETTIEIDGEPDEVWDQLLDGDWLGDDAAIPSMPGDEGEVTVDGERRVVLVEVVEPAHRLVFRWASFAEEPTQVAIELFELDHRTRVTVTERPLAPVMRSAAGARSLCGAAR